MDCQEVVGRLNARGHFTFSNRHSLNSGRNPLHRATILIVTTRQAARFWAIGEQVAAAALQHLEERGILRQTRFGFRRSW
jgi:hypothetical protein